MLIACMHTLPNLGSRPVLLHYYRISTLYYYCSNSNDGSSAAQHSHINYSYCHVTSVSYRPSASPTSRWKSRAAPGEYPPSSSPSSSQDYFLLPTSSIPPLPRLRFCPPALITVSSATFYDRFPLPTPKEPSTIWPAFRIALSTF